MKSFKIIDFLLYFYSLFALINILCIGFFCRDFLLVLNPNHRIFDPHFKAYEVNADGRETPIHIGNNCP